MHHLSKVKSIAELNEKELRKKIFNVESSWHSRYQSSSFVFISGFPLNYTEGDLLIIFSQYGVVIDINMPKNRETKKSKGYAFIGYEDQRSTILAVDNFNGITLGTRVVLVDHVLNYNPPKHTSVEDGVNNSFHSNKHSYDASTRSNEDIHSHKDKYSKYDNSRNQKYGNKRKRSSSRH